MATVTPKSDVLGASIEQKIKAYGATTWFKHAQEKDKPFVLKTLESLPLVSTSESRAAFCQQKYSCTGERYKL